MEETINNCFEKIKQFTLNVNFQNKSELNSYIAVYDKLKEIETILENIENVGDFLSEKIKEKIIEKDILDKFGPSVLLYLVMNNR